MPLFFTEYLKSSCRVDGSGPLLCQLSFSFDSLTIYLFMKKRKEQGENQILLMAPSDLLLSRRYAKIIKEYIFLF